MRCERSACATGFSDNVEARFEGALPTCGRKDPPRIHKGILRSEKYLRIAYPHPAHKARVRSGATTGQQTAFGE
jgi:hypothetical protein